MTIKEMRGLSTEELQVKLAETHKTLFDLRFKRALHQLDNPAQLRGFRHRVAQIKTVLKEKERASALASTAGGSNS